MDLVWQEIITSDIKLLMLISSFTATEIMEKGLDSRTFYVDLIAAYFATIRNPKDVPCILFFKVLVSTLENY